MKTYRNDPAVARIEAALPDYLVQGEEHPAEEWTQVGDFNIHVDRWYASAPKAVMVLLHGGGGNGRLLAPYARMAVRAGADVIAPDLPGYGLTQVRRKSAIRYDDWRDTACALVDRAAGRGLPVIVFGLSMGGMLAYDTAARTEKVDLLVASCFLDVSDPQVQRVIARWPWLAGFSARALSIAPWLTDPIPFPMTLAAKMPEIANDQNVTRAIVADRRAGGNAMPLGFLRTYLGSEPLTPPNRFDICPVVLVHPADDRWTPVEVTKPFFDALNVPKKCVMLENAGHFPIEQPGVDQLGQEIRLAIKSVTSN